MERRKRPTVTLPKRSPKERLLELVKDVLIVCLMLSAVYLAARSQLYTGLAGEGTLLAQMAGWLRPAPEKENGDHTPGVPGEPVPAVRLAICHGVGDNGSPVRYGVQYDDEVLLPIVSTLSSYFTEGLASAGEPKEITAQQWLEVLRTPGVYLDLLGSVPLDYLGAEGLTQSARRLVLAWDGETTAALYYQEVESGHYYRCSTSVTWEGYLSDALQSYTDNGARYGFELEQDIYGGLSPELMLLSSVPRPAIYQAMRPLDLSNPNDRSTLENAMGFHGSDYQVPGEWVIREDDELRIATDGSMHYEASGSQLEVRYPALDGSGSPTRSAAIAAAYRLTQQAVTTWCGSAESAGRLLLSQVEELENGWKVSLDYVLDGAVVLFEDGRPAAEFTVSDGQVTSFTIRPRCYQETEHLSTLLSERLAAAALEGLQTQGEKAELLLFYEDSMNAMSAQWGGF